MPKKRNAGAVTRGQTCAQLQLELEFNAYRGLPLNSRGVKDDVFEGAAASHDAEVEDQFRSSSDLEHFVFLVNAWVAREVRV